MSRWNIATIFFLGASGQRREISLEPNCLNIITGASGTGKSALIKAIDYCLGASKCELPTHVRRRSLAVGVKWVSEAGEMILGRLIPASGTSTRMFVRAGRKLPLPNNLDEFEGATTIDAAKSFIERAFGIGDVVTDLEGGGPGRGRATVRLVTPYLFVTKEVIDSESVLLHGLERADKAKDIIATLPYFLRATDEASAIDERRLRQLQHALEREEIKERSRAAAETALKERAISLLTEAHRIGISQAPSFNASEQELMNALQVISETQIEAGTYPDESEFGALEAKRREILSLLEAARRQSKATRIAIREASGFQGAVARQREKLMLVEHFKGHQISTVCPLCDAPSSRGRETAQALQATLEKVRAESAVVERVKPRLLEQDQQLDIEVKRLNLELRRIDDQMKTSIRQSEEVIRLADLAQVRAHLLGRISYFLESSVDEPRQTRRDLNVLRAEITELEGRVDREAKRIKLQRAERKVSQFASEAFAVLPKVEPCVGSELEFSSREPEISIIEADSESILRMPDVGSDQNYLAVHIAFAFGLQRYFESVNAPVPGLLVIDQISRPYFPTSGEDVDETEVEGGEEDEDIQAMRKHLDFLFKETERRKGLQVLLIEHAYFADDPRYVAATRERWTRKSRRALIPLDWPLRSDF
jgi:hypothetical protein